MSTVTPQPRQSSNLPAVAPSRLPYHPAVEKQYGIDPTTWRALVESTFPSAKSTEAVLLALSYCKARRLDPFKRTVHIVPIWDKERQIEVETVWPGIAEYRTTAFRTKLYAGHDPVEFGPMVEQTFQDKNGEVTVRFPEWAQMTVYRIVDGQKCAFPGDRVYWLETYASKKSGAPNQMWADRPIGMLGKCAEAAALRGAFPEELGDEWTAEEANGRMLHGRTTIDVQVQSVEQPRSAAVVPKPAPAIERQPEQNLDMGQAAADAREPEPARQAAQEQSGAAGAVESETQRAPTPKDRQKALVTLDGRIEDAITTEALDQIGEQVACDPDLENIDREALGRAIQARREAIKASSKPSKRRGGQQTLV